MLTGQTSTLSEFRDMNVKFEFLSLLKAKVGRKSLDLQLPLKKGEDKIEIGEVLAELDSYLRNDGFDFIKNGIAEKKIIIFIKDSKGKLTGYMPGKKSFYTHGQIIVLTTPLAGG